MIFFRFLFVTYLLLSIVGCQKTSFTEPKPELYPIRGDEKYGYMDNTGKILVAPQYDFEFATNGKIVPFQMGKRPRRSGS